MFLYELPTTGAVSFADICIDHTPNKAYTAFLTNTTQARANVREALKKSKHRGQKDFLQLIKLLDEYVPHLRGIISCVAYDEISLKSEAIFSWRTTLSSNILNSSPRITVPGLHADLAFSLLTYAFALSGLARSTVLSLGRYELDRAITEIERKAKDDQLNVAVDFLRQASGIYTHIAETILPEWESNDQSGTGGFEKPPELSQGVASALAKMSLADAQGLAIRKYLSKSAYDSNIAPGPPLPPSHPRPNLLAKLHIECASLYASALSLIKASGSRKRSLESLGEISSNLRRYLTDEVAIHNALSKKWLGVNAGEYGKQNGGGEAVAFLMWAKKDLEDLKDGVKGINIGKDERQMRDSVKERVNVELESVNAFYKQYKKANDSLHFQPVPSQAGLSSRIPGGTVVFAAKPYTPPAPAFGPGSVNYIQRKAEDLRLSEGPKEPSHGAESQQDTLGAYAGAGSYF